MLYPLSYEGGVNIIREPDHPTRTGTTEKVSLV